MDLMEKILDFLEEQDLGSVVNVIQTELNTTKKPMDSESYLTQALEHQFPPESLAQNLQTMQNFIRKLEKIPIKRPKIPQFFKKVKKNSDTLKLPQLDEAQSVKSSFDYLQITPQLASPNHSLPYSENPSTQAILSEYEIEENEEDQYENSEDLGFSIYESRSSIDSELIQKLIEENNKLYQRVPKPKLIPLAILRQESLNYDGLLPDYAKFPECSDKYYPKELDNTTYDCFSVKVIYDREKTGFEDFKNYQVIINDLIAGRYRIIQSLGSGNFSQVVHCIDEVTNNKVCIKIIENNKETVDQALDEIKMLRFLKANHNLDSKNIVNYFDCFYHKEHLFIVTELLRDNLNVFLNYQQGTHSKAYFTMGRIQKLAHQILTGLEAMHALNVIHGDIKPANIVVKSYSECLFKIIDFGSASFVHDTHSSYAQHRNYRAPEVILGFHYNCKVDLWSLGCVLFEVFTGKVLFDCNTVQEFLAKVIGICGQLPSDYYKHGRHSRKYFSKENLIFLECADSFSNPKGNKKLKYFMPKKTSLKNRMKCKDLVFIDFIRSLLTPNKCDRPSASQALQHPFITETRYKDGLFNI